MPCGVEAIRFPTELFKDTGRTNLVSIRDEIVSEEEMKRRQEVAAAEAKLESARREARSLKTTIVRQQESIEALEKELDFIKSLDNVVLSPPKWTQGKASKSTHKGIPSLVLSDCHFDEVVDPAEVDGLNAYNREIAEMRLQRTIENTIKFSRKYVSGLTYDGFVLFVGGDMVTGTIHEELAQTNDAYMPDTVLHWSEQLSVALQMLVDEFGKVHVSGVVGNHGRNSHKPRMKGRVRDNWDWLIYKLVARDFKDNSNVTFQVPDSADCIVPIYNTDFLFTHGDQFRGGGGIAGVLSPVMRGDHRKRKRHMETDRPYDYMVMGHWHSYMNARRIIVNGSLKGYDEYAYMGNFDFEDPQQAFWINTPEHGPILHAPIFSQDRKAEGW
jgi:hypothetical protein